MGDNIFDKFLPSRSLEISEENIMEFFDTMYQRQEIWYNRFVKQTSKPWCSDKILNNHKFCNAYRELDKTSQYLIRNVISEENSAADIVWKSSLFRLFNNIEFFDVVTIPNYEDYNEKEFTSIIKEFEQFLPSTNKKAYAVNSWLAKGTTQGVACSKYILPSLHKSVGEITFHAFLSGENSIKNLIKTMTDVTGIGKFIAHEWFIDLCYVDKYNKYNLKSIFDENSWTNVGPGAEFGLRTMFPSKKGNINMLKDLQDLSKNALPKDFKYIKFNKSTQKYELCEWNITLTNIEFWCCEYAKYWKIKHKIGRQRDIFSPTSKQLLF